MTREWYHVMPNPQTGHEAHVMGVAYNKSTNAEALYDAFAKLRDDCERKGLRTRVLMESYNCPTEDVIISGGYIPYKECLPPKGLMRAFGASKVTAFREKVSGEVLAVLQALEFGIPVMFCDRNHWLSVDRMVARYTLHQLEEMAARALSVVVQEAVDKQVPVVMVQNALLPTFPELSKERQMVMAEHALAATKDGPALVVIGGQHVAGFKEHWGNPCDLQELMSVPEAPGMAKQQELQKRALLLALFMSTSAFPPESVTDSMPDTTDAETEFVRERYSSYRTIFQRKLLESAVPEQDVMKVMNAGMDAQGLPSLLKLLEEMAMVP